MQQAERDANQIIDLMLHNPSEVEMWVTALRNIFRQLRLQQDLSEESSEIPTPAPLGKTLTCSEAILRIRTCLRLLNRVAVRKSARADVNTEQEMLGMNPLCFMQCILSLASIAAQFPHQNNTFDVFLVPNEMLLTSLHKRISLKKLLVLYFTLFLFSTCSQRYRLFKLAQLTKLGRDLIRIKNICEVCESGVKLKIAIRKLDYLKIQIRVPLKNCADIVKSKSLETQQKSTPSQLLPRVSNRVLYFKNRELRNIARSFGVARVLSDQKELCRIFELSTSLELVTDSDEEFPQHVLVRLVTQKEKLEMVCNNWREN